MKWTRKNKALLAVATIVLLFLVDFCRIQISLSNIIARAKLGATVDAIEADVGKATDRGSWSGDDGSGVTLSYRRPYVLEHLLITVPTKISLSPFYIVYTEGSYMENSPTVRLDFDERGRLASVGKRGFASRTTRVVKSSRR